MTPPEAPTSDRPTDLLADRLGLGLLLLTVAVWLPALGADYVWDDVPLVVNNPILADRGRWGELLTADLWGSTGIPYFKEGYYRPLVLLSFAFDRLLGGGPMVAHLQSVAWHLLACALLWRLLRRILPAPAASLGLAVFALHPAQVEAVVWVAARNDLMATALLLGALLLLDRDEVRPGPLLAGGLCALAALLSKESALLASPILGVMAWARSGRPGRLLAHAALLGAVLAWLGLRLSLGLAWPEGVDLERLREVAPATLALQARTLLWPLGLAPGAHLSWPPPIPWFFLGLGTVLAGGLLAFGRRPALAGLSFAALGLGPSLAAIAATGLVGDRYLYLALAGFALALGAASAAAPRLGLGLALAMGLLGAGLSVRQMPTWRDNLSLWSAAMARYPSPYVYTALARVLDLGGDPAAAAPWYRKAIEPPGPFEEACYRITAVDLASGAFQQALDDGRYALSVGCVPVPELMAPMAMATAALGRWDEAELRAAEAEPDPTGVSTVVRAAAAARRGDLGPLRVAVAEHPELDPGPLYQQVAQLLSASGEEAAATLVLGAAAGLSPPSPPASD